MVGRSASLQVGKDTSGLDAYQLMFDPAMGDMGKGLEPNCTLALPDGRCVKVGFPVGSHDRAEMLTLTVGALEQSAPEVIPDDQVKAAREKLNPAGIEIDYITFSGNGGGGGGPVVTIKPDGMSDAEALNKFYEALGYFYQGPWIFILQLAP